MELIDIIKSLKTKPNYKDLQSDVLVWALQNLFNEPIFDRYPVLYFVTQEPEYNMWKTLSIFLAKDNFLSLFSFETRFGIYLDLKRWLIKVIKRNHIVGL